MTESADDRAELERLREAVARLEAERAAPPSGPTGRQGWWRPVVVTLCLMLVAMLAPLSIVAIWARDIVSDTDRYVETVTPLADDPAVQDVVVQRITSEIVTRIDVRAVTQEAIDALADRGLPPRAALGLTALTGPLAEGVKSFIEDHVRALVTSPEFATAWVEANRQAHDQMVAVLTGETGNAVEVSGNSVKLNLAVMVDAVKARLLDRGFNLAERIPTVSAQFTLFESEDLAKAQTGFRLLKASARVLPFLALALLAVAVGVARNRRRTLIAGSLVVAGSMVLLGGALNLFRIVYLDAVPTDQLPTDAAGVIYDTLVRFIRTNLRAVFVLFLVVAAVAWVTGPATAPTAVRRGTRHGLDAVRHGRDSAGLSTGPVGEFLHTYRGPIRGLVLGVALLAYVLTDHPTGESTIVILLVAGLVLLLVELLARGEPRTGEPATPESASSSS
jgi:hypothetical protein